MQVIRKLVADSNDHSWRAPRENAKWLPEIISRVDKISDKARVRFIMHYRL